jgi:chromate transporter
LNAVVLYFLLLRATALSFSGFASVPLIREDLVVQRAVLSDEQLNSAIAICQASPGPLGLYVVVVGYFVAGVPGALAAAPALATPAILAIPIARTVRRHRDSQVCGASAAIVIASCVLMAMTSVTLVSDAASTTPLAALVVVGFIALASGRVPPVVVVRASACRVLHSRGESGRIQSASAYSSCVEPGKVRW